MRMRYTKTSKDKYVYINPSVHLAEPSHRAYLRYITLSTPTAAISNCVDALKHAGVANEVQHHHGLKGLALLRQTEEFRVEGLGFRVYGLTLRGRGLKELVAHLQNVGS